MLVLSAKVHIPAKRMRLIERERLALLLDQGRGCKLTVVTAPAGYGKSTALGAWAALQKHVAWVNLEKSENDLHRFWAYVLASIRAACPFLREPSQDLLTAWNVNTIEGWIGELIELVSGIEEEIILVLDDYHVITDKRIHESLEAWLSGLPGHVHLYISGRAEPPLKLPRLRMSGQLHLVGLKDLRFTREEGERFFRDSVEMPLTSREIDAILDQTEGWIGGMTLVALSWQNRSHPVGVPAQFSGRHRDVSDYLIAEVLDQQPADVQSFLLHTSICNRLSAPFCDALTEIDEGQRMLEELDRSQLFLLSLDDQRRWYRYHRLFQDFLQAQLQIRYPDRVARLHLEAGKWLEQNDYLEEAVEHYLQAEQFGDAMRLIQQLQDKLSPSLLESMRGWLLRIPGELLRESPELEMSCIVLLLCSGRLEEAEKRLERVGASLHDAEEGGLGDDRELDDDGELVDNREPDDYRRLSERQQCWQGRYHTARMILAYERKDYEEMLHYGERSAEASSSKSGDLLSMLLKPLDPGLVGRQFLAQIGSLRVAEQVISAAIRLWEEKNHDDFTAVSYGSYSALLYEWNRLDEAEFWLERALEIGSGEKVSALSMLLLKARILQVRQAYTEAVELLTDGMARLDHWGQSESQLRIAAELSRISLAQGDVSSAVRCMEESGLEVALDPLVPAYMQEYAVLAKIWLAQKRFDEAKFLLNRLHRVAQAHDRPLDEVRILVLKSIVYAQSGQQQMAMLKLGKALKMAEEDECIRTFADEGPMLLELLSAYETMRPHSILLGELSRVSLDYVKKLLCCMRSELGLPEMSQALLTAQELRILQLIESKLTNKEIAGTLSVSVTTVKTHTNNIYRKLDVKSRFEAVHRGTELGLL
ncbi:LuxR C-terminal-related transcriptional regulator [Brevibacillus ruminantium]|uniref:LuxR C-terminal-related transcriptional regulator n=1 Tax=Brevibacillus ruminantium TaxID=2950604 RepID=A0ABY4WES0_9BACL|nr:LuxR C-terminal-related transcriptional regulator [Brevibacillus ruminantium]USG65356.1 LuxR C-terminal-related transcriptional regulator [Brevibacillus ruminantium]